MICLVIVTPMKYCERIDYIFFINQNKLQLHGVLSFFFLITLHILIALVVIFMD